MIRPIFIKLQKRTINIDEIASINFIYPGNGVATILLKQVYQDRDGAECDSVQTVGQGEFDNLKTFFEPYDNPSMLTVIDLTAKEQSNVESDT